MARGRGDGVFRITSDMLERIDTGFPGRIASYLAERYQSAADMPHPALVARVERVLARGELLGFRMAQHQCDLAEAEWLTGDALWDDARFRAILARRFDNAEDKARRVRRIFVSGQGG